MAIPMLKIRQSQDRLIFNMGIHILVRRHLYIETAPGVFIRHIKVEKKRPKFYNRHFNGILVTEGICILIQIRYKFVSKCPIDNMYELIQVMARHPTYYNPLPEPILT